MSGLVGKLGPETINEEGKESKDPELQAYESHDQDEGALQAHDQKDGGPAEKRSRTIIA